MSTENGVAADVLAAVATVQRNCDIADAHHAQGMSLCAYLLDMREYWRWRQQLPFDAPFEKDRLSAWIADCEARWDELREGEQRYAAIRAGQDPFDEVAATAALDGLGLVVGAGVGRFGRPLFCLAEQHSSARREGVDIVVAGRELARGMTAPPAVSREGRVLIRLDAMQRWLWSRFEEWRHHPHPHGFAASWALHAGVRGDAVDRLAAALPDAVLAVERMALAEVETLVLHELAEIAFGRELDDESGSDWDELLEAVDDRKTETFVRSLRDLAADCTRTLPTLVERDAVASIHFWFGNLEGMRRALAPGLYDAYLAWCDGDRRRLERALAAGAGHWRAACGRVLERWRRDGGVALPELANDLEAFAQR